MKPSWRGKSEFRPLTITCRPESAYTNFYHCTVVDQIVDTDLDCVQVIGPLVGMAPERVLVARMVDRWVGREDRPGRESIHPWY